MGAMNKSEQIFTISKSSDNKGVTFNVDVNPDIKETADLYGALGAALLLIAKNTGESDEDALKTFVKSYYLLSNFGEVTNYEFSRRKPPSTCRPWMNTESF